MHNGEEGWGRGNVTGESTAKFLLLGLDAKGLQRALRAAGRLGWVGRWMTKTPAILHLRSRQETCRLMPPGDFFGGGGGKYHRK